MGISPGMATALGAQLPACATGCSAPTRRCRRSAPHRLQVARASGNQGQGINDAKAKAAIESLDELLPPPPPLPATDNSQEQQQQQQQRSDDEGQEGAKEEGWAWFDRPASEKQTAPLRKTGMQVHRCRLLPGRVGRRSHCSHPSALPYIPPHSPVSPRLPPLSPPTHPHKQHNNSLAPAAPTLTRSG